MPRFPGCEDLNASNHEKEQCAKEKMLQYIYANLKYPVKAAEASVEGMVVLQFAVTAEGLLDDIKIVRDIGAGCGQAAADVIEKMNAEKLTWIPGYQRGKAVAVIYTLPVKFKLDGGSKIMEVEKPRFGDEVFKVVEEMPRFPGCEDKELNLKDKEACAKENMLIYIYSNLKYPAEARKKGIEGKVVVQFIVEKDGSMSDIKIMRDIGGGCGQACVDVLNSINENGLTWVSGKQGGEPVRVLYTLPVSFKLEGNTKKSKMK